MDDIASDIRTYMAGTSARAPLEDGWAFQGQPLYFYKSHMVDPFTDASGARVHTDKVIYIHRNPLDVFVSYLNYLSRKVGNQTAERHGFDIDTVEGLSEGRMEWFFSRWTAEGSLFPADRAVGSWFAHVKRFRDRAAAGEAVHVVRYEDLHEDFETTATALFAFLGVTPADISAVHSSADQSTRPDNKVVWKRQTDNYRNFLTEAQIARFALVWEAELAEIGYSF